jgi:hypothetical protein
MNARYPFPGGAFLAAAARAQQPDQLRRIGYLSTGEEADSAGQAQIAAFRKGLEEFGWTDGRNVRIDFRFATDVATYEGLPRSWSNSGLKQSLPQEPLLPRRCDSILYPSRLYLCRLRILSLPVS